MQPTSLYWHGVALATVVVWAFLLRVRAPWRTHAAVALIVGWAGALFSWSVALDPALGSVSGRVVSARTHQPIARARVYAPEGDRWVRTDASGAFTLPGIGTGKLVRVTVRARGYETAYDEVEVRESKETAGLLFRMSLRTPTFSLYNGERTFTAGEAPVVNVTGALLSDFTVSLYRIDAYASRAAVTDPYKRQALGARLDREGRAIFETRWTAEPDLDGDFDGQIRLPAQQNGLYFVRVASNEGSLVRCAWFLVTDLALVTRRSPHEVLVYAHAFSTGKPVAGAMVEFFDGRRSVRKAVTGRDGTYLWKAPGKGALALVGQQADSYAYSRLDGFSAGDQSDPYRIYLYTERPIYRPGHVVHIRGMARRDRDRAYTVPQGETVQVRLDDPNGVAISTQTATVGPFGGFAVDVALPARTALGDCSVSARIGETSGRAWFKVAQYRKPEFAVEVTPERPRCRTGDTVRAKISARYFFGAPVAGAQATYSVYESWHHFDRVRFLDLDDGMERPEHYGGLTAQGTVRLDENGEASISFRPEASTHDRSFFIEVEVEDASHRAVDASADVLVTVGDYWIDASTDRWGYKPGETVKVDVTSRAFEGDAPRPRTPLHASLARVDYVEKTEKGVSTLERKTEEVWSQNGETNGAGALTLSVVPPSDGAYELRLTSQDERGSVINQTLWFFVASSAPTTRAYGSRDLALLLDAPRHAAGSKARVVVTSRVPDAAVLLCIDGRRLHHHQVVEMRGTAATVELPVEAAYFPNVQLSAFTIHDKQLITDEVDLVVDTHDHGLKIDIRPDRAVYEPGETVKARVHITDAQGRPVEAELSMGVVDAAIYALAPDGTEKITDFFYGLERSLVRTEYSFAPDYSGGRSKDDDPRVRRNFKDTAWWAPSLRTDAHGDARVAFALPDNITAWRFTVRAITRDHLVGEATREIVARKPLLVRLEVPRFMVEHDSMELSAVVHNETDAAHRVAVEMDAEGVRLAGEAQTATLPARTSRRFAWTVEAERAGVARVRVRARADGDASSAGAPEQGLQDAMALSFPVLAHGVMQLQSGAGQAAPASSWVATVPRGSDPARARLTVYLTPSLAAAAMQGLDYLAAYPYGCVEQTMSAFVPDIVAARVLRALGRRDAALERRLPDMVARGLDHVYDSQRPDGGWGWWKDDATNPYVTAYVVSGLHRARQAGVAVRADVWKRAVAALEKLATEDVGEFREGSGEVRQRTVWDVKAYEARVLDEIGEDVHDLALAVARHERALSVHSQALLAQTLWHVGERSAAQALLGRIRAQVDETETQAHWESKTLGYAWTADPVETTSAVLRAILMIDPGSPQIDRIARWLVTYRRGAGWTNTRDTAAAVDVLLDLLLARPREMHGGGTAQVLVNGRVAASVPLSTAVLGEACTVRVAASLLRPGSNEVVVRRSGGGALYWAARLETFTPDEVTSGTDRGVQVTRDYAIIETRKDDRGRVVTTPVPLAAGAAVPLGARVRVTVTVRSARALPYVLVEDTLVAGCELVEPEASRNGSGFGWVGREVRDDRLSVFAARLEPGVHRLVYEVRAEAPGTYHVRPAESFLMYTPEVRGSSAESVFTIRAEGAR